MARLPPVELVGLLARSSGRRRSASSTAGRARAGGGRDGAHGGYLVAARMRHREIDVQHLGQRARHLLLGGRRRPRRSRARNPCEETLLAALGGERPRALLLTHIHFDHAGAAGALVRRWPDLPVYVHERGAPHLVDPERLVASAAPALRRARTCDQPVGRGRAGAGGATCTCSRAARRGLAGGFRVAYTPGPRLAPRLSTCTRTTGRRSSATWPACGSRRRTVTLAPTPPPDIDVEAWERVARHRSPAGSPRALGAHPLRRRRGRAARSSTRVARRASTLAGRARRARRPGGLQGRAARARRRERRRRPTPRSPRRPRRPTTSSSGSTATGASRRGAGALASPDAADRRAPARRGGPGTGLGGNWRVIVRNDDHNTFDHVAARSRATIPGVSSRGLRARRRDPQQPARRSSGAARRSRPSSTGSSSATRG